MNETEYTNFLCKFEERTLDDIENGAGLEYPLTQNFVDTPAGYLSFDEIFLIIHKHVGNKSFVISVLPTDKVIEHRQFCGSIGIHDRLGRREIRFEEITFILQELDIVEIVALPFGRIVTHWWVYNVAEVNVDVSEPGELEVFLDVICKAGGQLITSVKDKHIERWRFRGDIDIDFHLKTT